MIIILNCYTDNATGNNVPRSTTLSVAVLVTILVGSVIALITVTALLICSLYVGHFCHNNVM